MFVLEPLCRKEERLVIGLMSGTSADGIDAALCRIRGSGLDTRVTQEAFLCTDFDTKVRERILSLAGGEIGGTRELLLLSNLLGRLYAESCIKLCQQAGVSPQEIDLVGSHGQTLWHQPAPAAYLGYEVTGTLQMGEPSYINEALGCPVISDFRVRDMAAADRAHRWCPIRSFCSIGTKTPPSACKISAASAT